MTWRSSSSSSSSSLPCGNSFALFRYGLFLLFEGGGFRDGLSVLSVRVCAFMDDGMDGTDGMEWTKKKEEEEFIEFSARTHYYVLVCFVFLRAALCLGQGEKRSGAVLLVRNEGGDEEGGEEKKKTRRRFLAVGWLCGLPLFLTSLLRLIVIV